jgi:aminoglycoside 3-N-acetyltransferase
MLFSWRSRLDFVAGDNSGVIHQLRALGVAPGDLLLVHAAFSKIRPVDGGPAGVIAALLQAIGPTGTLVMPSMSDDDEHPFDARQTTCLAMGIVAETFWRMPGVLRSDSPHAFAAIGPAAAQITADHPIELPHGLNSPVGRVNELDGKILLLGAGHDANTTIHLAESLAGVRYRLAKTAVVWRNGELATVAYTETDHCCERFNLVDGWLDEIGAQRRGRVGHADARLMRAADVTAIVTERLRADETVFLHQPGVDEECDAARASIPP